MSSLIISILFLLLSIQIAEAAEIASLDLANRGNRRKSIGHIHVESDNLSLFQSYLFLNTKGLDAMSILCKFMHEPINE